MTKITYNDGMKIYWDHPIEMEDGVILRADIFCPEAAGKYPVIMTLWCLWKMARLQRWI